MHRTRKPRVSIGMPVFNGSRYLALALDAILAQTYTDFELVICDNASTDATADICRSYAARDQRVRYHRNARNLGAAANFNRCFELAVGEYFKWAAHDDLLAAEFVRKAVLALDEHPDAVLCQSLVEMIDEHGSSLGSYDPGRLGTDAVRASDRFWGRLRECWCKEAFGLIRSSALARTGLIGAYGDADRALVAELTLLGRFITIPEPLFMNREHSARYTRSAIYNPRQNLSWYTGTRSSRFVMQQWKLYATYVRSVRRHCTERSERLRCYAQLVRSLGKNWNFALLALDPIVALEPRALGAAIGFKRRLFGHKRWSDLFAEATHETAPRRRRAGADSGAPTAARRP